MLGENKTPSLPTSTPPGGYKSTESYTAPQPAAVVGEGAAKAQESKPGVTSGGTAAKVAATADSGQVAAVTKPSGKEPAVIDKSGTPEGSGSVSTGAALKTTAPVPAKSDVAEAQTTSNPVVVVDAEQSKPIAGGEATKPVIPAPELMNGADRNATAPSKEKEQKPEAKRPEGVAEDGNKGVPAAAQAVGAGLQVDEKMGSLGNGKPPEKTPMGLDVAVEEGLMEAVAGDVGLKSHPIAVLDRTDTSDSATMQSHPISVLERSETAEEAAIPTEQVRAAAEAVKGSARGNSVTGSGDASGTSHRSRRRAGGHGRGGRRGHGHKTESSRGAHRGTGSGRHARRGRSRGSHRS